MGKKRAAPATPTKATKRPAARVTPSKSGHTPAWADAGLAHLKTTALAPLVERHGPPSYLAEPVAEDSACAALCRIVVGQQLAGAAAASIWRRTLGALCGGDFDRAAVLATARGDDMDDETRQACGLSRAKARAVLAVCRAFEAGDLSDALLEEAPVADLRERLCAIKGIGPWSCDMYLIFSLKKPDVLPLGDLGVRSGIAKFFSVRGHGKNGSLDQKKDAATMEELLAPFAPYRSLATYYMWRVADTKA